jgi:hypothetical protein
MREGCSSLMLILQTNPRPADHTNNFRSDSALARAIKAN